MPHARTHTQTTPHRAKYAKFSGAQVQVYVTQTAQFYDVSKTYSCKFPSMPLEISILKFKVVLQVGADGTQNIYCSACSKDCSTVVNCCQHSGFSFFPPASPASPDLSQLPLFLLRQVREPEKESRVKAKRVEGLKS